MTSAPRRRNKPIPAVDIVIESPLWARGRGIKTMLRRAVGEAACVTARGGELAIVLIDDAAIRVLNRNWLRKDEPTNVLSFPTRQRFADGPDHLGDIVIAYQTSAREAKAEHKPFGHHLAHLAVHGFLHLVGYDHETDAQAETMEDLEIAALARIGVPNPYIARVRKG